MKEQKKQTISRRQSLGLLAGGAGLLAHPNATLLAQESSPQTIAIDPKPRFELSSYLYMQFMEPLGATDASVEAAWEHLRDDWREDVVAVSAEVRKDDGRVREVLSQEAHLGGVGVDLNHHAEFGGQLHDFRPLGRVVAIPGHVVAELAQPDEPEPAMRGVHHVVASKRRRDSRRTGHWISPQVSRV